MKKFPKILIVPLCVAAYLIGDYLYEPFRLPDYLDKILSGANLSSFDSTIGPMDAIVHELANWSTYEETKSDPRKGFEDEDRQITTATGYVFRREKVHLIIYNQRMNNWAAEKIIDNFRSDLEFLFWRLGPKIQHDKAMQQGEDTPSWGDCLNDFRRAGFTAIVITNDEKTWNFPIR